MKTDTNPAAACGYILPEDPTAQRKLAADLGVETLISSIHPVGASGWTLVDELEARKIVDQWAERNGRTGRHWRNTRKFALKRIRRDGLAAGRIHFGPKPEQPKTEIEAMFGPKH